ncbi:hypothetical protein DL93DRAFT_2160334 [Clavulina sp. PMI_390]|nr:hypothetical protein DL93DRAFT_2160334 [Clavulina sp. PMI_390]
MIPIVPSTLAEPEPRWILPLVDKPNVEVLRYVIARPSRAAVASGLMIAVILMGVVTVQLSSYSRRFYKERKVLVVIANGLLLCLGEALYRALVTGFSEGEGFVTLCQRYMLLIIGNNFADALATYSLAIPIASIFGNCHLGTALNILISIRLAISVTGAHAIYVTIDSTTAADHLASPCKWIQSLILGTECIICGVLIAASFRAIKNGSPKHPVIQDIYRYAVPSYFLTGFWCKSAFMTACFGIPLAADERDSLQANPSVFDGSLRGQRNRKAKWVQSSSKIIVAHDIHTESCHDGPLEVELTERLERKFPDEEESRSYFTALDTPKSSEECGEGPSA